MFTENMGYGAYPANQPHETGELLRGFVLLIAGVTQNRRRNRALEDSEAALGGWGGLPPQVLIPDVPADVVQLPTGSGPQTVRGYLERASATPGPVLICVTGHLMPDRRGELHVTLRASSASSVRYDGLPWAWLVETLRLRDPRRTLLIADLTAAEPLRARLAAAPGGIAEQLPLWAVVTRQPSHDERAHAFTRALTSAARRGFADLPGLVDPAALHPAIAASAQLPDGTVQIVPPPDSVLKLANPLPGAGASRNAVAPYGGARPQGQRTAPPVPTPPVPTPPVPTVPVPTVPMPSPAPWPAAVGIPEVGADKSAYAEATALEPAAHPAPKVPPTPEPTALEPRSPGGEPPGVPVGLPGALDGLAERSGAFAYQDRVSELREAVAAGDFDTALRLARTIAHDMAALPGLGPDHPETLDAWETLAWLTARAGNTDEAVSLYAETARRSARIHGPGHPATRAAADAAHALWLMLPNAQRARELGPAVIALRELVVGKGIGAPQPASAPVAAPVTAQVAALPVPPQVGLADAGAAPITADPPAATRPHPEPTHAPSPNGTGPAPPAVAPDRTRTAPAAHEAVPAASPSVAAIEPTRSVPPPPPMPKVPPAPRPDPGPPAEFPPPAGSRADSTPASGAPAAGTAPVGEEPLPPPPELREALAEVAAIAASGRRDEALGAADAVVDAVAADLGPDHPNTLNVREIRAYLTAEAGRLAEAVTAYLDIAEVRLSTRGPGHPETVSAVDNAHVLWLRLGDDEPPTVETGRRLAAVRESVPGPGGRALTVVRERLARLTAPHPTEATAPEPAPEKTVSPDTTPDTTPGPAPAPASASAPRHYPDVESGAHTSQAVPAGMPETAPGPGQEATAGDAVPQDVQSTTPSTTQGHAPDNARNTAPDAPQTTTPGTTPGTTPNTAPDHAPDNTQDAAPESGGAGVPPPPDEVRAYLKAIKAASADADHVAALTLAEELTRGVEARHGPVHPFTLNAYEVRAHLTATAGLFATAARQYTTLARRLAEAAHPDDPGARSAADAAQALWLRLGQTEAARNLAPGIVDLRRLVPGPDDSALAAAYDHLNMLTRDA